MRDRLPADAETLEASAPLARYFDCPVCGQRVDRKELEAVYYHCDEPHAPRPADASRYD